MSTNHYQKHVAFGAKLIMVGFGSIGKAILPLVLRHVDIQPEQITILTKKNEGADIAKKYGVNFIIEEVTKQNYEALLSKYLKADDFLLNLSVDVSSMALISYCQKNGILYLDTCIEPWEGGYVDAQLSASERSCYAMREAVLKLKHPTEQRATALVTHGANPGLASHFVKQALLNIATDTGTAVTKPKNQQEWAKLAEQLGVKVIHIAERDTQLSNQKKSQGEFVNTWSIDGFVSEGAQPAELGWGTHERHWPADGHQHDFGSRCAIYLNRPGATTFVRTWTPLSGPFHAFLITHTESISIADYFTLKSGDSVQYRPTVHFAYHPCNDALISLLDLTGKEWQQQPTQRILFDEIIEGMDELGVLLMGHAKGAYWYGSQLTIEQTRKLAPYNNATSLQVAIGALSGMIWVMAHPTCGIVEPDEVDHEYILKIANPYLGDMVGHYTDWTPLLNREKLFPETLDKTDPWQFVNMRVV